MRFKFYIFGFLWTKLFDWFCLSKNNQSLGTCCDRGTPVPIPNTVVKPVSADGSLRARVGRCLDFDCFFYF